MINISDLKKYQIKIPVYSPRMAITKNTNNNECCGGLWRKRSPYTLLMGM
jgi:hypothetical protein